MSTTAFRNNLVDNSVHQICSTFPQKLFYFCENLVKSYTPVILSKILQKMNDETLCHVNFNCYY